MSSPPTKNPDADATAKATPIATANATVIASQVTVSYDTYPASQEHSAPAIAGQPDSSKLTATLKSATGGADKNWSAPQWLRDKLTSSGWGSGPVSTLNKLRGQFLRRQSGPKNVQREHYTNSELSILRSEVIQQVRGHRTSARILNEKPESLKTAMARVTVNYNRRVGYLVVGEGEEPYQVRTRVSLEGKCRRTPALLTILRRK